MTFQKIDRLPKHKNCKHWWVFREDYLGYNLYYCSKCLLETAKIPDYQIKKYLKKMLNKKPKEEAK